jgi:ABC-type glycerol-3-phosphate transport system permease component
MLLPKFRRKLFLTLLVSPLLLFPSLLILKRRHLLNSLKSLSLLFIGVKIPSHTLLWSKFAKLFLKVEILLLL